MGQNSVTQIVTKPKKNTICDKTQKLKLWPHLKTQIVTKHKKNCDKSKKIKLWQNLKPQILTQLKISNSDKTKKINCDSSIVTVVTVAVERVVIVTYFRKKQPDTFTTDEMLLVQLFLIFGMF